MKSFNAVKLKDIIGIQSVNRLNSKPNPQQLLMEIENEILELEDYNTPNSKYYSKIVVPVTGNKIVSLTA